MGHQHHFLSRLDRVHLPHVELALGLYRDHGLVHFLLGHLSLPEGAERVAISLDDPEQGPFLIVTRGGRFVTCLGRGMKPGRLPILTRERLDAIAAKGGDIRARLAAVRAEGGARKLLLRLYQAADDLSREEMIAASGVAPLLCGELLRLIATASSTLDSVRESIERALRRKDKLDASWRALLEAYYKTFWCSIHMTTLVAGNVRGLLDRVDEQQRREVRTFFSANAFEHSAPAPVAKAIWSVGRMGKGLLASYKEAYLEASGVREVIEMALCLSAIGLRQARVRAEVTKVLAAMPRDFGRDPSPDEVRRWVGAIVGLCALGFDAPEQMLVRQRHIGAKHAVALTADLPPGHACRFARVEDVPDEISLPLAVNVDGDFLARFNDLAPVFFALPWLARAKVEDLYMPRTFIAATRVPWTPEHTLSLFRETVKLKKQCAQEPRQGPTRKGPCPCGSGKKYKRCCGSVV